jgi:hypothetical protein
VCRGRVLPLTHSGSDAVVVPALLPVIIMDFFAHGQKRNLSTRADEYKRLECFAATPLRERVVTWGVFFSLLVLVFFRAPMLLLEPRLWAEEASLFLRYAYTHSFLESVTFIPQNLGYILFVINLPTAIAAHVFPLAYAPAVTTYFSLSILLVLFALILWGHSSVWETIGKKTLACLIILFAPSSTAEVWLNSTNAQVYCGLIAACLLLEDLRAISACRRWTYRVLLGFCGLSGVYTIFFGGMFLIKAWLEKSREALIHVGIVACATLVQVTVFLYAYFSNTLNTKRLASLNLGKAVPGLFLHQFVLPVFGSQGERRLSTTVSVLVPTSRDFLVSSVPWLTGILAVGYLCVLLYTILPRTHQHSQMLFLGCYVCTAVGTTIFSLHGVPGGRYAVVSGVLLLFMLLNNLQIPPLNLRSMFCAVFLVWALIVGTMGYRTNGAQDYFVCNADCPKWADELQRCELTSECVLTVWPYPRWKFLWPARPVTVAPG